MSRSSLSKPAGLRRGLARWNARGPETIFRASLVEKGGLGGYRASRASIASTSAPALRRSSASTPDRSSASRTLASCARTRLRCSGQLRTPSVPVWYTASTASSAERVRAATSGPSAFATSAAVASPASSERCFTAPEKRDANWMVSSPKVCSFWPDSLPHRRPPPEHPRPPRESRGARAWDKNPDHGGRGGGGGRGRSRRAGRPAPRTPRARVAHRRLPLVAGGRRDRGRGDGRPPRRRRARRDDRRRAQCLHVLHPADGDR